MKRNLAGCALFLTLAVTMRFAHHSIAVFFCNPHGVIK